MLHFRSPALDTALPDALAAGLGAEDSSVFARSGIDGAAQVETARGIVALSDLRPGDKLITRDKGLQPLRWIGQSSVLYRDPDALAPRGKGPVNLCAGRQGVDPDAPDLIVAPGQRVLVRNAKNAVLFATDEVMAEAGDLCHLDGVEEQGSASGVWHHVLLDSHELIRVNGIWMETFAPDMDALRVAYPEAWDAITEALPRLKYENTAANYVAARLSLDAREARQVDRL